MDKRYLNMLHLGEFEDVCGMLQCNPATGLTTEAAEKRLKANGKNEFNLPNPKECKKCKYVRNLFYGFGAQMLICALLCITLHCIRAQAEGNQQIQDTGFAVVGGIMIFLFLLAGFCRYLQENDDYLAVTAFRELMPMYCCVLRDGRKQVIRSVCVVVGDILLLSYGERIAADVRFFVALDLEVNSFALTGFSVSDTINPDDRHANKWEARNMGFAGCLVTKGSGQGLVVACGNDTEVGMVAKMGSVSTPSSRPRKHLKQLSVFKYIVAAVVIVALAICLLIGTELNFAIYLEFILGFIINLTPLYITPTIYFGLSRTKKRMLEQGLEIRNLEAGSTLGLTTVICCGVTGSVTIRSWKVSELLVNGELLSVDYDYLGGDYFMKLIQAAVLCNHAYFTPGQRGLPLIERTFEGSDYEKALLRLSARFVVSIMQVRNRYNRLAAKPYDSMIGLQASVHRSVNQDNEIEYQLIIRGPWTVVGEYCSYCYVNDELVDLDETLRASISNTARKLKKLARHTYAFASKVLQPDDLMFSLISKGFGPDSQGAFEKFMKHYSDSMEFLGMISAVNPPMYNIRNAIENCRHAGIKIVLCTTGEPVYTRAITNFIGMGEAVLINMAFMEDNQLTQRSNIEQLLYTNEEVIFCSVSVQQRLMIVDICLQMGGVVTAIGAIARDTPALRRAHVGVAASASAYVTHCCADATVLESNFVTLVQAIAESRLLFENKKKVLTYALSVSLTKLLIHFLDTFSIIPIRMFIITGVCIDFFVCFLPSLALFSENPELDLLTVKPNVYEDYLLDRTVLFIAYIQVGVVQASAVMIAYFVFMAHNGFLPRTLLKLNEQWNDDTEDELVDSYGQEWTRAARANLDYRMSAVFTITISLMQAVNLVMSKTSLQNVLDNIFDNVRLLIALAFLIGYSILFTFLDSPNWLLTLSVNYLPIFCRIWPLMILLVIFETGRRYLMRRYPKSWMSAQFYHRNVSNF